MLNLVLGLQSVGCFTRFFNQFLKSPPTFSVTLASLNCNLVCVCVCALQWTVQCVILPHA